MSSAPLRLILAGLGARGRHWREAIARSPDCVAVAYCDPSEAARAAARSAGQEAPVFATLEEAARSVEADAIVLATPPGTRAEHVALACERRLAMLVEKPLALSVAEAEGFVTQAETAGVALMVGLNFRFLAVTKRSLELLGSEHLGAPAFARFTYERWRDGTLSRLNKYPLKMAQPMLWEQSIHHFDLMRFVYASEPLEVSCYTWNPPWSMYGGDSNVSALFRFENGMVVNYHGTWQGNWATPGFEWRTECARGVLVQRDQFGALAYAPRDEPELTPVSLPAHEAWLTDTSGVLEAFCGHLLRGAPLQCSGRDHLRSLHMVEACILSSQRGETVAFAALGRDAAASEVAMV